MQARRRSRWLAAGLGAGALALGLATPTAAHADDSPQKTTTYRPKKIQIRPDVVTYPRLVLAGHLSIGPHAPPEEICIQEGAQIICDTTGGFFAVGGNVELRARLYKPLMLNVGLMGGVSPIPQSSYSGIIMPRFGIGVYGPIALIRLQAHLPFGLGGSQYRAAGTRNDVALDNWGNIAGGAEIGLRLPIKERAHLEAIGGVMVGPRAIRNTDFEENDQDRILVTFTFGLGGSFDLVPDNKKRKASK